MQRILLTSLPLRGVLLKAVALAMTSLACLALAPAHAEDWPVPGRNVRLILPTPGGTGTGDTIGRLFAEELSKRLKVPFVVDNKPGANGNIGASAAAQAPNDGYHFLFSWAGTLAVNPAMYKQMGYDSQRDFAPIALLAEVPNILVVNNDLPVKDLASFTRYAKANPGKLSYGSTGIGSSMHLAGELYSRETGVEMVHVPFTNPGNATTNLISGELQLMFQLVPGIASQVKAGRVRAIGVMAPQRSPALPDVPSMAELAYCAEDFVVEDWHNFGADYDRTLMAWHARFEAAWPRLKSRYDERFYRMWRYYLLCCAGTFRARDNQLWQVVLSPRGVPGGYRRP